jgi:guanylate kinase
MAGKASLETRLKNAHYRIKDEDDYERVIVNTR